MRGTMIFRGFATWMVAAVLIPLLPACIGEACGMFAAAPRHESLVAADCCSGSCPMPQRDRCSFSSETRGEETPVTTQAGFTANEHTTIPMGQLSASSVAFASPCSSTDFTSEISGVIPFSTPPLTLLHSQFLI